MKLLTAIMSGIMAVSPVAVGSSPTQSDNKIAYTYEVNEDGKTATLTERIIRRLLEKRPLLMKWEGICLSVFIEIPVVHRIDIRGWKL